VRVLAAIGVVAAGALLANLRVRAQEAGARPQESRGLDPDLWFNHVEVIAAEKIGQETVRYVSNIFKYYVAYQLVVEQQHAREKALQDSKSR